MIDGWSALALNTAPDSENQIHGDEIAKQYGFKGGLVPGVIISAYLIQPAVVAWGRDFLERGAAHVKVGSPLYDNEMFEVSILEQSAQSYRAEILRPDGTASASAEVSLPDVAETAPAKRGDAIMPADFRGPQATPETFEKLKRDGCKAFRYPWGGENEMKVYLRDTSSIPDLLRLDRDGYAHMGFLLGCSNWSLAANARMNPWVHLETRSQNYRAVAPGTSIVAETTVSEFYNRKGHEFVDVDVNLFDEADDACVCTIALRAIYRLRGL